MGRREKKLEAFGAALASARLARGLTQRHLGELLGGVTQSAISAWEAGEAEPLPETVFAVEEALGLPGGELSCVLGYLPLGEPEVVSSVPDAIVADPLLSATEKRGLLALYEEFTATVAPRRGHGADACGDHRLRKMRSIRTAYR